MFPISRQKIFTSRSKSTPFRPGYISTPEDSRKVRAQLKIRETTDYASQGTDRDPMSYLVHPVQRISLALVIAHYLIPLSFSIVLFCPMSTTVEIMLPLGFALERDKMKHAQSLRKEKLASTEKKIFVLKSCNRSLQLLVTHTESIDYSKEWESL